MSVDIYVFLMKYTEAGVKYADAEHSKARWKQIESSLQGTLGGKVLSHYVCTGPYDAVVTVQVKPGQDFQIFQCLRILRAVGDVEITVLRAFEFGQFVGGGAARS